MGKAGKITAGLAGLMLAGAVGFWFVTAPQPLGQTRIDAAANGADAARGEILFWAGGCASCHASPQAEGDAQTRLAGGLALETPYGQFVAPNISQHPQDGIGGWSLGDFMNAMKRGVDPAGAVLYPAFPYTSYARMPDADIADLFAYMKTLPAVEGRAPANELTFPYSLRRGVGLWQRLYLSEEPVIALAPDAADAVKRGQYLVEGPGHCGECHTPRNAFGALDKARWLQGAPAAEGGGTVPGIAPGGAIDDWSADDIATYLETGFTPDFDSVGGTMVEVQQNMARLSAQDRQAIGEYLKALPE
ncbi:c-type cytochrome [Limoniibacter endophyticus]|uniref:Diacylglycerol kinase n=2 Tax=Bacteria TaxID=2 RepID=A0A8J3GH81_9HYPH|nr:diacylglycerol kinase [Limoniibacter endophyticus]